MYQSHDLHKSLSFVYKQIPSISYANFSSIATVDRSRELFSRKQFNNDSLGNVEPRAHWWLCVGIGWRKWREIQSKRNCFAKYRISQLIFPLCASGSVSWQRHNMHSWRTAFPIGVLRSCQSIQWCRWKWLFGNHPLANRRWWIPFFIF